MALPEYIARNEALGDGSNDEFTFDFKIESLDELLVIVTDTTDTEVFRVDGNDTTYISEVDYDSEEGGGTVTLVDPPTNLYNVSLILKMDEPTQPSEFKNKGDFTLSRFESALDRLGRQIARLTYQAARSIKLSELMLAGDVEDFDTEIPTPVADRLIGINSTADALELIDLDAEVTAIVNAAILAATPGIIAAAEAAAAAEALALWTAMTINVFGTKAAPRVIVDATGITSGDSHMSTTNEVQRVFVGGDSAGENIITANPQIEAGTEVGQIMYVCGADETNYITLNDGNGLSLNGAWSSNDYNSLQLFWDGTVWCEDGRKL